MGVYLNPRNDGFAEAIHSEIYVDKTGLIAYTNQYLNTEQNLSVSAGRDVLASPWHCGCLRPTTAGDVIPESFSAV